MRQVITLGFVLFVAYLFWKDIKKREQSISWVPLIWMFLAGSRWVSSWFNLGAPLTSVDAYAEGSPVDRAVFLTLIVWGVVVLLRRKIAWRQLLEDNWWIALYLGYCLSSVLWTDEPVILIKRWIKDLGNPIMALVMLTESRPYEALAITLRRLSFLLLPFSVMFVRWYPELGRNFRLDGSPMYTGVGHQKNDLGAMCLIAGIYFFWKLLQQRGSRPTAAEKIDRYDMVLMGMLVYLLRLSDSQTSLSCLVVSIMLLLLSRAKVIAKKPARIVAVAALGAVAFASLDSTLHFKDQLLSLLGRDPTLTNRTQLWEVVREQTTNPLVGAGFMSFWTGERMQAIWDALGIGINQAHNGYLEQYLNLGYIGVGFIVVMMLIGLFKTRRALASQPSEGMLRLCLLTMAALYNYTEASFYGISNIWVLLLAACIDVSGIRTDRAVAKAPQQATLAAAPSPAPVRAHGAGVSRVSRLPRYTPRNSRWQRSRTA